MNQIKGWYISIKNISKLEHAKVVRESAIEYRTPGEVSHHHPWEKNQRHLPGVPVHEHMFGMRKELHEFSHQHGASSLRVEGDVAGSKSRRRAEDRWVRRQRLAHKKHIDRRTHAEDLSGENAGMRTAVATYQKQLNTDVKL